MLKFTDWLIPVGATNRPGKRMNPTYITIHECSLGEEKRPPDRNRDYYISLMENPKEIEVGYHYLVTDNEIIRFIPDNEIAYHTGSIGGNLHSIGIERLVNVDVDFEKAISIQAKLTATLMYKRLITLDRVVPHKHWDSKECPARLLAGQNGGWSGFKSRVQHYFENEDFIEEAFR